MGLCIGFSNLSVYREKCSSVRKMDSAIMSGGTAPCGQSAPWLKKVQHLTHKMVERSTEARTPPICVQRRSAMPAIFACGHSLCTHPNPCRVVKPRDEGQLETDLAPGKKTRVGWNIAAVHRDSQAKSSMPMDRGFWSNACWAPSKMCGCQSPQTQICDQTARRKHM